MLTSFLKALGQIFDRRFRGVLLRGVGLTIVMLIALTVVVLWGLEWLVPDTVTLPWIGPIGGLDWAAGAGGLAVMLVASIFLMIPVASAVMGFFLEEVAAAVEDKHYPALPPARRMPWSEQLGEAATAFLLLIVANVLMLAAYVFAGPLAPVLFITVNGYLLGREYFTLVAMRRVGRAEAKALHRRHLALSWLAGALLAAPLAIPILNLIMPVLGVATFTHIFQRLKR
ncbi:EI24 domain-containing protein [Falsirhodobacter sp. 20TX0035]|uniref:EI24 domain-containing protein n=1 Tax=Falsirhodobacter sp. 20TX0035 TaxID=3022019 RepID=UPI00232A7BEF|nr:EI24 domain-containing protein [Falsirhodobacter sp. 20TX0035]MDB6454426.1 EI24 domain-containing protein [Falsirhodobacter sp. 20TX0035]